MRVPCEFYGKHLLLQPPDSRFPFHLVAQHGNQCALIVDAYAPCAMEANGLPADMDRCPLLAAINARLGDPS